MGAAFGNMPFIGLLSTASGSGYGDPVPSSPAAAGTPIPRISAFRKTDGIHDEEQEMPQTGSEESRSMPAAPISLGESSPEGHCAAASRLHKDSARTGKASGAHGERREIS